MSIKKILKTTLTLLLVLSFCFAFCACGKISEMITPDPLKAEAKVFSVGGINLTLTSAFEEKSLEGYDKFYDGKKIGAIVLKEGFEKYPALQDYDFDGYVDLVIKANEEKMSVDLEVKTEDGITYFEYFYKNALFNQEYKYYSVILELTDGYAMVQYFCSLDDYEKYKPTFVDWAKKITVDKVYKLEKKEFSIEELKITLPSCYVCDDEYTVSNLDGAQQYYTMKDSDIIFSFEHFGRNGISSSWTLEDYAKIIKEGNAKLHMDAVEYTDGFAHTQFGVQNDMKDEYYKYLLVMYKTEKSFVMVQFGCRFDDFEEYKPHFLEWAKSATYTELSE